MNRIHHHIHNASNQKCSESAINLLTDIGPAADDAMPVLLTKLDDPSSSIRLSAADAVWLIGGRSDLAAPVLVELLETLASMQKDQQGDNCPELNQHTGGKDQDAEKNCRSHCSSTDISS